MASWADLEASGSGRVAYALEVAGVGCYTTLSGWYPSTNFDTTRHHPWLDPIAMPLLDEEINFLEGSIKVAPLMFRIQANDTMISEVKDWRVRGYGRLTATLTTTATVASLDDTSWASASGPAWIGGEVVSYVGSTATTLTSLTRGLMGTDAKTHVYDAAERIRPVVADGPHTIAGRRCRLLAAVVDSTGAVGDATVLYRGRVTNSLQISPTSWRVQVEHISKVFEQEIGQGMPSSAIEQGYWFSGVAGSFSQVTFTQDASGTISTETITVDSGMYRDADLAANINAKLTGSSLSIKPQIEFSDGSWLFALRQTAAGTSLRFEVVEGDPLWCLGFTPGVHQTPPNASYTAAADDEPRLLNLDFNAPEARPQVYVQDTTGFTAGLYAQIPGHGHAKIDTVSGNTVTFRPERFWQETRNAARISIADEDDQMILRHVFEWHNESLKTALQRALYQKSGQSEPESWCASGSVAADFDWTELDSAAGSVPDILKRWTDTVTKPIKVWDLFGPLLGLLAIAPRITDNGKIGFQRLRTPIDTIADSVNLDSDVWELGGAAEASANLDDAPLINRISVKYGWNYRMGDDGEWYDPLEITWDDGINTLGHVRPFTYQIRGIHPTSRLELEREINAQVTATHYGLFGRLATSVEIPCTWTSRQFKCGDVVSVTHDLLPDVTEGAYGVTSRNGIILKKRHSSTGRQTDLLRVRIPPPNKGTGIAPCAHATSFTSSPNVLHFTSTTAYSPSGTSDLSWFSAGTKAWIIDYDSLSNSFTLADNQVNILSVGASHIKINEDLTTSFPSANGVYIYYPGYGAGNAAQDAYAHIASASTIPHLGGDEDAQEWTL